MYHQKTWEHIIPMAIVYIVISISYLFPQVTGSAHDFSGTGWSNGEICVVCHTPHNADISVVTAPLWNHELSTSSYTVYSSPTMDESVPQPLGISKLCLSCHDGTIATDNYGGNMNGVNFITSSANLGTDLSNDHPISITWTHNTVGRISGNTWGHCTSCHDNIGEDPAKFPMPFYSYDGGITYKVECSSCHDPHYNGHDKMLRLSNDKSNICMTCH